MKTPFLTLCLAGFCISVESLCAGAPPAAPAPAPAPTTYVAQTKSTFSVPAQARNPFWPIGFFPRPKTAAAVVDNDLLRIPVEMFHVTSIFAGDDGIAVINGKDYAKGQFLTVPNGASVARLLITRIEDGYIVVQYKLLVAKIPISRK